MAILLDVTAPAHVPVLAAELLEICAPERGATVVDCTFGQGGHAQLFAECIGPGGLLVAIDRDPAARARFEELHGDWQCEARFVQGDFADVLAALLDEGLEADVVYFDLGVSSLQIDQPERGFSYTRDAPLDMRMDPSAPLSARDLLNAWDERQLAQVLRRYGEERYAARIAREICARRKRRPIETTGELVAAIEAALPAAARRLGHGHPAKRTFQALRIAVNHELESLDRALPLAFELTRPGGRIAAISFHSLEDRRVKNFMRELARGCVCPPDFPICTCGRQPRAELLTPRALRPSADELAANPRSASARLRALRKLPEGDGEGRRPASDHRKQERAA
ncbi:16S rRNA (cytosine(1402)-N(4))-methyltransferase RsmH [Thermoleophilum album]|uniref:Ribosomal RNA small subunit methyltransferase H n=1 Tax=Thermoleophilum album TaxID=29539 RepID=A0A1H6G033_THEAL|nr:16S rRNA (cytosine(1402)-N(4))-methyltransferase RsmH [Thermoleophilum album]SEH15364.1 16S rRNA (cytosine1402-N4)-methyltransferase [Thermoleophilum album]